LTAPRSDRPAARAREESPERRTSVRRVFMKKAAGRYRGGSCQGNSFIPPRNVFFMDTHWGKFLAERRYKISRVPPRSAGLQIFRTWGCACGKVAAPARSRSDCRYIIP
jgi:hypothetical protein